MSIDFLMDELQTRFGEDVRDLEQPTTGVEPYSLALQYLMDMSVIPYGIIGLSGPQKSYKTTAALDMAAQFTRPDVGGGCVIANTERKWSETKMPNMFGAGYATGKFKIIACAKLEDWQVIGSAIFKSMRTTFEKAKSIRGKKRMTKEDKSWMAANGSPAPICLIVDSITGAQTEMIQKKVDEGGHGVSTFYDRAKIMWQWLSAWSARIENIPCTVLAVQHLLPESDGAGMPGRGPALKEVGGNNFGFMCSIAFRCRAIGRKFTASKRVIRVRLEVYFSSLGRDKRRLELDFVEMEDPTTGERRDYFDHDLAAVEVLLKHAKGTDLYGPRFKEKFGDIVTYGKVGSEMVSCKMLGISKDAAIPIRELGRVINTTMRDEFRYVFAIQQKCVLDSNGNPVPTNGKLEAPPFGPDIKSASSHEDADMEALGEEEEEEEGGA